MDTIEAELVKDRLKESSDRYQELKNKCSSLGDRLSDLSHKQGEFHDQSNKLLTSITAVEDKLEGISSDPEELRAQLEQLKAMSNETIAQQSQIADLETCGKDLTQILKQFDTSPEQLQKVNEIIREISFRCDSLNEEINTRYNTLQMALTKSQDVKEAIDSLLLWLRDVEVALVNERPISLYRENLLEQLNEIKAIKNDIDSHKPSIDSVQQAANELMKTCDLEMAKKVEKKISDLSTMFSSVESRAIQRSNSLQEISDKLSKFHQDLQISNDWLVSCIDMLESKEMAQLPTAIFKQRVQTVSKERESRMQPIKDLISSGNELISNPKTGEASSLKEAIADLERRWTNFDLLLAMKEEDVSFREKKGDEFEEKKNAVLDWLTNMETQTDNLEPIAVVIEAVKKQLDELQVK